MAEENEFGEKIKDYEEAPTRKLGGGLSIIIKLVSIAFTLFQFYTAAFGAFPNIRQRAIHVGFAFFLCFALIPFRKTGKDQTKIPIWDMICMGLAVLVAFYMFFNYGWIMDHPAESRNMDISLGIVTILLLLESGRRAVGTAFPVLTLLFFIYAYFGPYFPGMWGHRGMGIEELIQELFLSDRGIWGMITGISATVVAMFIIFGAMLSFTGGGQTFIDIALRVAGKLKGGAGKISVVSSSLFGMISGSAVANVGVDGEFTIPMMKKLGYRKELASAIEAAASTGGQIMPPVMGAGAFIMAEILGIPYIKICAAAAIPALLYYVALWFAIQFEAEKVGVRKVSSHLIPSFKNIMAMDRSLPLGIPVIVLLYFLIAGYTPELSCVWSVLSALLLYFATRRSWGDLKNTFLKLVKTLEATGHSLIMIACLCASASAIVGIVNATGIGIKFSELVLSFSAGHTLPALLITMFVALVLGMGVPTTAAYLLAVSVCGTALIKLGIGPLQAHLFVFYFAIISSITPPVAPGIYVASAIGRANVWIAGYDAVRLALAGFIVPFMFVYGPELLLIGDSLAIIWACLTAIIGTICLAGGAMGYFVKKTHWLERILLIAAALLLIKPGLKTDIVGFVLLGIVFATQKFVPRAQD
jgi:TRAP transporter 4TM/12TM fusion protein